MPNGSWFLAEGAESGTPTGFHTFYLVANENDDPVDARAWFIADTGVLKYQAFTVAARSRLTVALSGAAGTGAFASIFQSTTPGRDIYVARSIYWGPNFEAHRRVGDERWRRVVSRRLERGERRHFLLISTAERSHHVDVRFLTPRDR